MGRIRKLYRAGTVFCVLRGVIGKPQKVHFWTVWAGLEGVPGLGSQGPSKPGKVRFPASPGRDTGNRGLGRVPKPGPRGASQMPKKGGRQTPLLDPKHTIGRTAFWALSRNLGSGTGPRGFFQRRARVWRPQFWTPRFGAPDPNRKGVSGTEVGGPEVDFGRDPEKDPIRRPDSEVGLGTPFGRGPKSRRWVKRGLSLKGSNEN